MNLGTTYLPAFVATVLVLSGLTLLPGRSREAAGTVIGGDPQLESDSGNTACDLPPYSEGMSRQGFRNGSGPVELPPIDSALPAKVATATFALG